MTPIMIVPYDNNAAERPGCSGFNSRKSSLPNNGYASPELYSLE